VPTETVFLVNPASANGSTGRHWPEIHRKAATRGLTGDALFSDPRASVKLVAVAPHPLYSKLSIQRADGTVLKFRVHRMWCEEYDALVAALGGAARPTFQA